MTKYTAADFANARFAEHEQGAFAARIEGDAWPWADSNLRSHTDAEMARAGWVPVPTKPTIEFTESQVEAIGRDAINYFKPGGTWADWARAVFMSADFEVIPDPEPTNADKLKDILYSKGSLSEYQATIFAQHLDAHGVTAPKVKGN